MSSAIERATLRIERSLGASRVLTERGACEPYARDESEAEVVTPDCVVLAECSEHVTAALAVYMAIGFVGLTVFAMKRVGVGRRQFLRDTVPTWLLSCVAAIWVSARIYRVGLLMTGKRPSMKELVRWVRYA